MARRAAFGNRPSCRGMTLIELLVVVAILGVVAALAMSGVAAARNAGRRVSCAVRMHDLGVAGLATTL